MSAAVNLRAPAVTFPPGDFLYFLRLSSGRRVSRSGGDPGTLASPTKFYGPARPPCRRARRLKISSQQPSAEIIHKIALHPFIILDVINVRTACESKKSHFSQHGIAIDCSLSNVPQAHLSLHAHYADSRIILCAGNVAVIMVMLLRLLSSNCKRHYVLSQPPSSLRNPTP